MKNICVIFIMIVFFVSTKAYAQFDDLLDKAKDKVKDKVEKTEDKALDKALNGSNDSNKKADNNNQQQNNNNGNVNSSQATPTNQSQSVTVYKNYDFVPGDKIIFESQLADEQTGEIPSQFTLSEGQMDVESVNGENVIHIPQGPAVTFAPRMITNSYLSDQFTVEFDFKNEAYGVGRVHLEFGDDESLDPELNFAAGDGVDWTTGNAPYPSALNADADHQNTWHHYAIAINKNAGKVYVDQYRLLNVNNLPGKAQKIVFTIDGYENSFIKNFRVAAGGIGIYKMVTTNGKIITHGILFDVNKATIKPQSMGTINEIYRVLQKDPSLKFEIDGHTDNSGNAAHNMTLSQQRADAVKGELVSLGIDASRLTTKGFGDTKPIGSNDTPEGKANNRRVEFIRM